MAVGNNVPYMGWEAILGIAKETTFGTFVTSTCFLEFNSESLQHTIEEIKVEAINSTRDFTKRLLGNASVEGSIDAPFNLGSDACLNLLKIAMGGTVTSVAGSSSSYTHTFYAGNIEDNKGSAGASDMKSLSIAVRPGNSASSTWNFYGCRVNSMTLKAEAGSPVVMTVDIMGKGASTSATIPAASFSTINPCNFVGISFQTGVTISAVSAEYIKSLELSINNNISADHRVLGSREVAKLPPSMRAISLKVSQIYDTTTAYDRFTGATITAISIEFDSDIPLGSSSGTYKATFNLPCCYLNSNTPQVGDAGMISQDLEYTCMYKTDPGYAVRATVINLTASYD